VPQQRITRDDVASMVEARRELGDEMEPSIISLGTGIPITAIAAEQGGVVGMLVVWAGIVGVNVSFARRK
jgi:hypothetical protein